MPGHIEFMLCVLHSWSSKPVLLAYLRPWFGMVCMGVPFCLNLHVKMSLQPELAFCHSD